MKYFLDIFRSPQDIHRVVFAGILAALASHFEFLYNNTAQNLSIVHTDDYLLVSITTVVYIFSALWCFLSSEYNLKLYGRIVVGASWTILAHRVFYGTSSVGSVFFDIIFPFY